MTEDFKITMEDWEEKIKKWDLYPEAIRNIVISSNDEQLVKLITMLVHYMGLVNEIGEAGGKIKKIIRDKMMIPKLFDLDLGKEFGDADWYLTTIERDLGFTKAQILELNNQKLSKRDVKGKMHGSGDHREDEK